MKNLQILKISVLLDYRKVLDLFFHALTIDIPFLTSITMHTTGIAKKLYKVKIQRKNLKESKYESEKENTTLPER